jgi:N4-gp56 family major capsid protein
MAATKRADLTSYFTTYIYPMAIPTLEAELLMYRFGEPKPIPANAGDTVQVQFPANLTASTTPIDELVGLIGSSISYTNASLQVNFFANDVALSKLADVVNEINWRDGAMGRLIYNAADTGDLLARDALTGMATNVQLVNDRAAVNNLVATDTHNVEEMNQATGTLRNLNVRSHRLTPGCYAHIISTRVAQDIRGDTGGGSNPNELTWYDINRRNDLAMIEQARIGKTMGLEVFETSQIQRLTNSGSVAYYNNFVIGDNLFMTGAIGDLPNAPDSINSGRSLLHLIPPEYSQATPHGNRWVLGWDFYGGAGRIDDTRGVLLQAASGS